MNPPILFLLSFVGPLYHQIEEQTKQIEWLSDYREARRQSKDKNLPILIDVGGINCFYCRKMDVTTLMHPEVVTVIRSNFISLKLNASKDRELINGLGVRLLPTFIIADPDGKVLSSVEGFSPSDSFQAFMIDALTKMPGAQDSANLLAEATRATGEGNMEKAKSLLRSIVEKAPLSNTGKKASVLLTELDNRQSMDPDSSSQAKEPPKTLNVPGSLASRSLVKEPPASSLTLELLGRMLSDRKSGRMVQAHELAQQIKSLSPGTSAEADAQRVIDDIMADSQTMKQLVEAQSDRLAEILFQAAETALKQGQPQQAIYYLDRVSQVFPNSRFSNMAQTRLAQIQGPPR